MNSLKRRIDDSDIFSVIEATQELRVFLFDSPCLLNILSKGKDFKVEFIIMNTSMMDSEDGSIGQYLWRELYPNKLDPCMKLSKGKFLLFDCIHYNRKKFTILQIIKIYAFVRGGIHLRTAEKEEYKDLQAVFEMIKFNGDLSLLDHTVYVIILVTYEALERNKERLLN